MLLVELKKRGVKFPVVYMCDNHSSNHDFNVMKWCEENGIRLFTEPENSSGFLQSCDQINRQFHIAYAKGVDHIRHEFGPDTAINLGMFLHILSLIWFSWSTPIDRMTAFRRVGITRVLDLNAVDRSRFAVVDQAVAHEEQQRASTRGVSRTAQDVHPTQLQATPERLKKKRGLEYYMWKCEDQQRVIDNLSNTPLLPSKCQVLQPPKLSIPKQSKRQLNKQHGSFTMQGLLEKKKRKMEEAEAEAKQKQKARKVQEKAKNEKNAIKNNKREEWTVDNTGYEMCTCWKVGGRACKGGNAHLCGCCGDVKSKICRVAKCMEDLGYPRVEKAGSEMKV